MKHIKHDELRLQLNEFLIRGHTQKSLSPCVVPTILTPKKDGTFRMCMDCHLINKITVKYMLPIPRLNDFLNTMAGLCLLKINRQSRYH